MDNRKLIGLARELLKAIEESKGVLTIEDVKVFLQILLRRQQRAAERRKPSEEKEE